LRQKAGEAGYFDNVAIMNFFTRRMRDMLHIVLCMSPVGEAFRKRIRMFPSLVNCCTIDWINPWPEEALISVSKNILKENTLIKDPTFIDKLSQMACFVHESVEEESERFYDSLKRRVYVTPKSFLDLLKSYEVFLKKKDLQLSTRRNILKNGLTILE
jgi:dynein heavy chain